MSSFIKNELQKDKFQQIICASLFSFEENWKAKSTLPGFVSKDKVSITKLFGKTLSLDTCYRQRWALQREIQNLSFDATVILQRLKIEPRLHYDQARNHKKSLLLACCHVRRRFNNDVVVAETTSRCLSSSGNQIAA